MAKRLTFNDRFRYIIESKGMTHTELEALTGVNATVIARYLAADRQIRSGTLEKIADALDVRPVEFVSPKPGKKGKRP